jgi:hypothetical protein
VVAEGSRQNHINMKCLIFLNARFPALLPDIHFLSFKVIRILPLNLFGLSYRLGMNKVDMTCF